MYVTEFELESFYHGPPLRFLDLGNGLNVALTASEPAARQLLHVIPGTLFGDARFFAAASSLALEDAQRTAVLVRTEDGAFRIERRWKDAGCPATVTAGDGQHVDLHRWEAHRAQVSAAEYADVFTFNVRQLRGMLQIRPRAMRALQALARELDDFALMPRRRTAKRAQPTSPVPLNDVVEKLSILQSRLAQSLSATNSVPTEADEHSERQERHEQLRRAERALQEARQQLAAAESEWDQVRATFLYVPLREQLAATDRELAQLQRPVGSSDTDLASESLRQLDERIVLIKSEWRTVRAERATLAKQRKDLARHGKTDELIPQLEALLWQEKTLIREDDALRQLKEHIQEQQRQIEYERREEKARGTPLLDATAEDARLITKLDSLADRLRDAERERELADELLAKAEAAPIVNPPRPSNDPVAIHEAEQRVASLRERVRWRDGLEQISHDRGQLDRQIRLLYRDQLLPMGTVLAFGIPFAIGAAMIIHALLSHDGSVRWNQVLWGFLIAFVTILIKVLRDRERDQLLTAARRKLARLDERLAQYGDASSVEESAIATQLQAAEQELQDLTSPLMESTGRETLDDPRALESARRRSSEKNARLRDLTHQWRELMIDLNLSPSLAPVHAREALAERALRQSESTPANPYRERESQLQSWQQEWERRQEGLRHQLAPFRHFVKELGRPVSDESISSMSETLHQAVRDSKERKQQRTQLQRTDRRLRQREADLCASGNRLMQQRQRIKREATTRQTKALDQEKQTAERRRILTAARDRQKQEVLSLQDRLSPDLNGSLGKMSENELADLADVKSKEIAGLRERVLRHAELYGQLKAQLQLEAIAKSHPASDSKAEAIRPLVDDLRRLQDQVQSLADRSVVRPTASADWNSHDSRYLHMASQNLRRLSGGQNLRIAMRGPNRRLACVDRYGSWCKLSELRESQFANVYFALWLARLEQYADRGIRFPVILQDPLMVTPPRRKTVVAKILREIAAKGHQMVLVTFLPRNASVLAELGVPIADIAQRQDSVDGAPSNAPAIPDHHEVTDEDARAADGDSSSDNYLTVL